MIGRCSIHDVAQWGRIGIAQLIGKKQCEDTGKGLCGGLADAGFRF